MRTIRISVASLVLVVISSILSHAEPSFGSNCAACHSLAVTGRLGLSGQTTTTDLGSARLDFTMPGPLKTYVVNPGDTVRITELVLNGTGNFAVSIRNFDQGGVFKSVNDHLSFSTPNLTANGWFLGSGSTYYYTSIVQDHSTPTFNFDIKVNAGTPADFYDLAVTFAGRDTVSGNLFSQQEDVYLNVVPEPQSWGAAAGLGVAGFGIVRRWIRRKRRVSSL